MGLGLAVLVIGCTRARNPEPETANTPTPIFEAILDGSNGCGEAREPGTTVETLTVEGLQRTFRLHVPAGYQPDQPAALVLNYHGFGSSAESQEEYTGMALQADASGFVTATLQGEGSPARWYVFGRSQTNPDDVAFTEEVIDRLDETLCIDRDRIYATGMSNGGGMSSALACNVNDVFAAVAPVAGSPFLRSDCQGKEPIPVIAFHGTQDLFVPFEGPEGRAGMSNQSARGNSLDWAEHNGCHLTLVSERIAADVVRESYTGCDNGADVVLYVIEGGGHTWPGAVPDVRFLGSSTTSISATELIWAFFEAHPKR